MPIEQNVQIAGLGREARQAPNILYFRPGRLRRAAWYATIKNSTTTQATSARPARSVDMNDNPVRLITREPEQQIVVDIPHTGEALVSAVPRWL